MTSLFLKDKYIVKHWLSHDQVRCRSYAVLEEMLLRWSLGWVFSHSSLHTFNNESLSWHYLFRYLQPICVSFWHPPKMQFHCWPTGTCAKELWPRRHPFKIYWLLTKSISSWHGYFLVPFTRFSQYYRSDGPFESILHLMGWKHYI